MLPNEKFEFLNLQKYWNKSRLAKTTPSVKGERLSLSKNYEVSSEILDDLVLHSKKNGAIGARMTGAGFGGCIVVLITSNNTNSFVNLMKEKFKDIWLVDKIWFYINGKKLRN